MDANREAAREALRRCMEAEFAALGAEDGLDAPSPTFAARMEKLLRQEKKAASFRGRRVLVAAAIVAACLVLAAWTPVGGMVVELMTTAYEGFMDYRPGPGLRTEIETPYAPSWLPEGFEEVSREILGDWDLTIVYQNAEGEDLLFYQTAPTAFSGAVDNENFHVYIEETSGLEILFGVTEKGTIAAWTQDLYLMEIVYRGKVELETLEKIILSVAPAP